MAKTEKVPVRDPQILSAEFLTQLQGGSNVELVKALLALNGGAAAALLAFVQAVWITSRPLVAPALFGIGIFALGAAFAAGFHLFRSWGLMAFQEGRLVGWKWLRRLYWISAVMSLALFVSGAVYVSIGIHRQL